MKVRLSFFFVALSVLFLSSCSSGDGVIQVGSTTPDTEPMIDFTQLDVENCLINTSSSELDVVTWNLEQFPLENEETVKVTADLIQRMDVDLIAVQEIRSTNDFEVLLDSLEGWSGEVFASGNLNVGYLYKDAEIDVLEMPFAIYPNESSPFPREPLVVKIQHINGLSLTFINIHLKCCGGTQNKTRREVASTLLKEYIDDTLPNDNVVILGDFNNTIVEENPEDNVFQNFITDSLNFRFITDKIANGPSSEWSFPSWPSHIDQVLVTNELFDNLGEVKTLTFDSCDARYSTLVSDHRPVYFALKAD